MQNWHDALLDLAVDDYTGLWEFEWRINELSPSAGGRSARDLARVALHELIRSGALKLFRGTSFSGEQVEVTVPEALEVVMRDAAWEPAGAGEAHLRAAASASGEKLYNGSGST